MKSNKSALPVVFLVVLIDLMGFGIILPLMPFYAERYQVSPIAIGFLYSIYSLAQLIFSPVWGALSDRLGRRPIMLISTLGSTLSYILFAFSHSYWVLFLSRLLAGVMGGNISAAQAYIADVTTHENRAKGMGLLGAAFGIGFVMGPAIATALMHPYFHRFGLPENSYALPGFFAAGLSLTSFLLVWAKLPESVNVGEIAKRPDEERVTRFGILDKRFWLALGAEKKGGVPSFLPLLMISGFVLAFGHSNLYSAFPLFCKETLGFTARDVGMQFVWLGLITVFIQGGLIRVLEKRFGEKKLFLTGGVFMVLGMALIPLAGSSGILTAFLALLAIGASLNGPTLNSLISKEADPHRVGAVMGSAQGLSALGRAIGPAWGGLLYGWSPRLPFWATAVCLTFTVWVGTRLLKNA